MKNKVKEYRMQLGLTQQELADKLCISRQSIFSIETGKYIPSTTLALKMAKLFRKKVEEVFSLEEED